MTARVLVGFLALTLLAAPLAAEAQPVGKTYRIAIVATALPVAEHTADPSYRAFFGELRRLGYVEGQNLVVDRRSALGRPERFPEIAAEVVGLNPDVILTGSNRVVRAIKAATATIPIVSAAMTSPVEGGLVTSLARPGATVVCNGYKDRAYLRRALIGQKLGHKVYIVVEKTSELPLLLAEAKEGEPRPLLLVLAAGLALDPVQSAVQPAHQCRDRLWIGSVGLTFRLQVHGR